MIADIAYVVALVASLVWFTMGFRYFSFQSETAAKAMVGRPHRDSPIFRTYAAGVRFLGGFNAAFALMALLLLICVISGSSLFEAPGERAIVLVVLAAAHFSQFLPNVPILRNGERHEDGAFWPVRSGPMLMIFVVDLAETVVNLGAGLLQLAA
ncbi:MAG: hypothetical protein AAF548_15860 [Actinomycetota bacterium]